MADETVTIEAIHGPYAGKRLTVSAADGKQAIADGWARDPFAPVEEPEEGDEPKKEPTEDERQAILEKADKAARKLRGEDAAKKEPEKRAMAAEESQAYQTRDARSQPAAPPKRK